MNALSPVSSPASAGSGRRGFVALDLGTSRTRSLVEGGFAIADRPSAVPPVPRASARRAAPRAGGSPVEPAPSARSGAPAGATAATAGSAVRLTPSGAAAGWLGAVRRRAPARPPAPAGSSGSARPPASAGSSGSAGAPVPAGSSRSAGAPGLAEVPASPGAEGLGSVWPIRHGMVVDPGACHRLARVVLQDARLAGAWPPRRVLVGVPVAATASDRRAVRVAVEEAAEDPSGCEVVLVEEPLAAAVGSGVDVTGPRPCLLLDVGAGIVEAAAIRDGAITDAVALQLSATTRSGLPPYAVDAVVEMTAGLLRRLPAHLRAAVRDDGLLLTGGGAPQAELAHRLRGELRMPVTVAPEPAHATIRGLVRLCLEPALAARVTARGR
ncbi:rod shape-determining protein [Nonomuraea pusilla]|uniref:rod shape-determining protein n=1 Tax=Nonomuraea pusilla TaxID=46177 RepID=UPI003331BC3C